MKAASIHSLWWNPWGDKGLDFDCKVSISVDTLAYDKEADYKILFLAEPLAILPTVNEDALRDSYEFDKIYTYDQSILDKYPQAELFEFGSSWLDFKDLKVSKTNNISFVTSSKNQTVGHQLRLDIFEMLKSIDILNGLRYYAHISSKYSHDKSKEIPSFHQRRNDFFETAKFHIAVENSQQRNYFTEKVIDCFASKTVPIYYGCPNIGDWFSMDGIITFQDLDELAVIIRHLDADSYSSRLKAVERNYEIAKQFHGDNDIAPRLTRKIIEEVNPVTTIQNKSINLCMIVKDEAHIIKRCLDSVKPLIDKVLVVDTGSSDNTIQVINDWIKKENMTGKVFKEPWKGFAHNRTLALRKSQQIGCDYSLMIDADEVLNFNKNFDSVKFKQSLNKDYYNVPTKTSGLFYYRPTLTSNKKNFKYTAIIHEYLEPPPGSSHADISYETEFWNTPIQDSSRNNDPRKFHKDAQLLEEALATEKDDFLRSRYTFYLANSYRDAGIPHLALPRYLERAEMGFWEEERYLSCLEAARLKEQLNHSEDSIISTFLKSQEHSPNRAEALHGAVKYCRTHNRNQLAYMLGKEGINKTFNSSFLFSEMWIYDYGMVDEFSIAAYWAEHYQESYDACQELLQNVSVPSSYLPRIERNLKFAKDKLPTSSSNSVKPLPSYMKIDLRDVRCCWINLDKHKDNAKNMTDQLKELGIKNHERLSARVVEPPPDTPKTICHYRGCAQSHIDILDNKDNGTPLLILEDDAKVTENFNPIIEVPVNTDAIYLGASHGNNEYVAADIGNGLARISNLYATHAILYITDSYRNAVSKTAQYFAYTLNTPFDLGCAQLQKEFFVVTPHKPYFYQADERDSANKWESITKTPLRLSTRNDLIEHP